MLKRIQLVLLIIADVFGINFLFRRLTRRKARILMYHGITATENLPNIYWLHVHRDEFRWQIEYLNKNFKIISGAELAKPGPLRDKLQQKTAAVTFDDGLANVYEVAWPILRTLNVPAICFVNPGLSENKQIIWSNVVFDYLVGTPDKSVDLTDLGLKNYTLPDNQEQRAGLANEIVRRIKEGDPDDIKKLLAIISSRTPSPDNTFREHSTLMTPEQIIALHQSDQFEIAGHTDSHMILSTLPPNLQRHEIASGQDRLHRWGVEPINVFAYPAGKSDAATVRILKEIGIKIAFTADDGLTDPDSDPYQICRISIGADTRRYEYKARLSGLYYFIARMRGRR